METKFLIALLLGALLAFTVADSGEGSDEDGGSGYKSFEKSNEEKDDDCDRLVEDSDKNGGKCDLTDGLEEVPDKADCTPAQKTIILDWIASLKVELSVSVTVDERLVIALSSLQKFQIENPDIYELIAYQNVSSWGFLASFTKVIEMRQSKKIESVFSLDDNDNCPLFDALTMGANGSYESAVNELINGSLIEICGNMTLSVKEKQQKIFDALVEFFGIHPEWESAFFQFKIQGFGSLQQFYQITRSVKQVSQVDVVFEGEVSECGFIVAFRNYIQIMQTSTKFSTSTKGTIKLFYERMVVELGKATSGKHRLAIMLKEFRSFMIMYPSFAKYIYSIEIIGFGSFFDLMWCSPGAFGNVPLPTPTPKQCSCTCTTLMPKNPF